MLLRLLRKHPDLFLLCFGLLAALVFLAVAELFLQLFWIPGGDMAITKFSRTPEYVDPVGYQPAPNTVLTGESKNSRQTFYTYEAAIDGHSRRMAPCGGEPPNGSFALFFGCSFTFGDGLTDEQTLPARFCAQLPGVESRNYAFGGYGVQQMFCHLIRPEIAGEVNAAAGLAFYVYIDHHLERLRGNVPWAEFSPRVDIENGLPVWKGPFKPSGPVEKFWAQADRLRLGKWFHEAFWRPSMTKSCRKFAQICAGSRNKLRNVWPDSDLRVVIFPHQTTAAIVAHQLKLEGVACLDYSLLFAGSDIPYEKLYFPDGHPTPENIEAVARQLAADIAADPEWGPRMAPALNPSP